MMYACCMSAHTNGSPNLRSERPMHNASETSLKIQRKHAQTVVKRKNAVNEHNRYDIMYVLYRYVNIYSCNLVPRVVESTTSDDPVFLNSSGGCRSVDLFTNWEMKHSVRPRIRAHII